MYMEIPECYANQFPGMVLRLNKAIYGLKESPRLWNKTLDEFFQGLELKPSEVDPCLYIMKRLKKVNISNGEDAVSAEYDYLYVLVYVDDLLLVSTSTELRQEVRQKLKKRFQR